MQLLRPKASPGLQGGFMMQAPVLGAAPTAAAPRSPPAWLCAHFSAPAAASQQWPRQRGEAVAGAALRLWLLRSAARCVVLLPQREQPGVAVRRGRVSSPPLLRPNTPCRPRPKTCFSYAQSATKCACWSGTPRQVSVCRAPAHGCRVLPRGWCMPTRPTPRTCASPGLTTALHAPPPDVRQASSSRAPAATCKTGSDGRLRMGRLALWTPTAASLACTCMMACSRWVPPCWWDLGGGGSW